MTDTVKMVMEQIDDDTGEAISRVTCEWYGQDRNTANAASIGLVGGVVNTVTEFAVGKSEGGDPVEMMKGNIR